VLAASDEHVSIGKRDGDVHVPCRREIGSAADAIARACLPRARRVEIHATEPDEQYAPVRKRVRGREWSEGRRGCSRSRDGDVSRRREVVSNAEDQGGGHGAFLWNFEEGASSDGV